MPWDWYGNDSVKATNASIAPLDRPPQWASAAQLAQPLAAPANSTRVIAGEKVREKKL
tara:strand:- start:20 stop:193 length:174 start_codon:yes stop_codon:yes gene_type:complete